MIYLDPERLDQFFKSVANGFTTTPRQVLLFFIVLALILLFLVVSYLVQRRRIHSRLYRQSATKYAELIDRRGTNSSKWDGMAAATGVSAPDAIAMWVADIRSRVDQ